MFQKFLGSFAAFLLCLAQVSAQHRTCAAEEVLQQQLLNNPAMRQEIERMEEHARKFAQTAHDRAVITIPVVVHVVWYSSTQNISTDEILSQITVLNDDFRRTNADAGNTPSEFQGVAADCEINFCMATQDPNGNATDGIQRRQTTVNGFGTNDAVKFYSSGGLDAWDRDKYLNIWVCNLSGGLLGYAQFPGGPANTDGVVCDYAYFGTINSTPPFDKGRTATHEVGHWLNCYHIWGDDGSSCSGSDSVSDTPNQADENYGCPSFPQISCSNGPNGDMFMNYMDYTDDACMNVFTSGQKNRMQSLFSAGGARVALASSPGCEPPSGDNCNAPSGLNTSGITQTSATCNWNAVSGATSYTLEWKKNADPTWTVVSNISGVSHTLNGLVAGTLYDYRLKADCDGNYSNYSATAQFTTASNCSDQYEPNNSNSKAKSIPINTAFTAQIAYSGDKDYYKFGNTSSQKHIKVELTTLPLDYDLKLYRGTTLVGTSENGGTQDEVIILNNATVSTNYKAYVYGYNGAWSNTQCYTFKASRNSTAWRTDGSDTNPGEEIPVEVVFENAGFGLFPNPAGEQVVVEVPVETEGKVSVAILDPSGKMVLSQQRTLAKGDNQFNFQLSQLPNGIYFVQVRNGSLAHTRKLLIQR